MFYVYLLHSARDNGFYIGFSTDLKKRLSEHRRGASFATKSRGPWKLIYYEAYTQREDAEGRERFLKGIHHVARLIVVIFNVVLEPLRDWEVVHLVPALVRRCGQIEVTTR